MEIEIGQTPNNVALDLREFQQSTPHLLACAHSQVPRGAGTPPFMPNITLDPVEIMLARYIAAERTRANAQGGVFNRQRSDEPMEDVELIGFAGELAFCKAFNYWPDLTIHPRSGGHDVTTRDGKTLDVKTSSYLNAHLYVTPDKEDKGTDRYALVIGAIPNFNVVGYANADEIFKEGNLADTGHGMSFSLSQKQLHLYD